MPTVTDSLPRLVRSHSDLTEVEADVLLVTTRPAEDGIEVLLASEVLCSVLVEAAAAVGHTGRAGSVARIPAPGSLRVASVLLVGLGSPASVRPSEAIAEERREQLRQSVGAAMRALDGISAVAIVPPEDGDETPGDLDAIVTGALLGAYRYTAYRSRVEGRTPPERVEILAPAETQVDLDRAEVVARAVAIARDQVNQPPLDLSPEAFADFIVAQARELDRALETEVLDEVQLREQGFGGLTGVGGGSARGPRLVKLSYRPSAATQHLAIVGKGITFDSGGISIKPAARMEHMKSDMAGAAAAAQALFVIAELELPVRVTAWLALAENMPSGSAMRPADVLRIYGGMTVEVTNTDAEGRLVLADALVAAQEERPDLLVDLATLTGAQVTALGYRTSGVMGTADARRRVLEAAESAGEPMWGMPIPSEMLGYFDSTTADLKNAGARAGGMLAAAAFLREFVEDGMEWAHLDIAGPAYNSDAAYGYTPLGGTGVPVRTLISLAERLCAG